MTYIIIEEPGNMATALSYIYIATNDSVTANNCNTCHSINCVLHILIPLNLDSNEQLQGSISFIAQK